MARQLYRETSGRIHFAEQNVCQRIGSLAAAEPCFQNSRQMFRLPVQYRRTACEMYEHNWFTQFSQLYEQVMLRVRHLDIHARRTLTAHLTRFAHGGYYHIRLAGYAQRLCFHRLCASAIPHLTTEHRTYRLRSGIVHEVRTLRVEQFGACDFECIFQSFFDGFVALRNGCYSPCAGHIRTCVSQWTDEGDSAFLSQRQEVLLVFQQYHTLAGNATCLCAVFRRENDLCPTRGVAVTIRVVKQAEFIFRFEDASAGLIDIFR